jgi:protein TonB
VLLISEKLEKYGRTLGRIVLRDGRDVGTELLKVGLAVPYEGGTKGEAPKGAPAAPAPKASESVPPERATTSPVPAPPPQPVVVAKPGPDLLKPGHPEGAPSNILLDVSNFPFTYYLRQLQNKITEKWTPPRGASVGGETAIVLFEIDREGQIKEPSVERSSGNAIYDQSAVRAVLEASPFPPLPQGYPGRSLRIRYGFEQPAPR